MRGAGSLGLRGRARFPTWSEDRDVSSARLGLKWGTSALYCKAAQHSEKRGSELPAGTLGPFLIFCPRPAETGWCSGRCLPTLAVLRRPYLRVIVRLPACNKFLRRLRLSFRASSYSKSVRDPWRRSTMPKKLVLSRDTIIVFKK